MGSTGFFDTAASKVCPPPSVLDPPSEFPLLPPSLALDALIGVRSLGARRSG